jgi:hypothetical protein
MELRSAGRLEARLQHRHQERLAPQRHLHPRRSRLRPGCHGWLQHLHLCTGAPGWSTGKRFVKRAEKGNRMS